MSQNVIKTIALSKFFNRKKNNEVCAFADVEFSLDSGECLLLHGASGSGKSSLLSILACLSKPTSGEYFCLEQPVSRWSENFSTAFRQKNIGMIFQHFRLMTDLTVAENIALPLVPLQFSRKEVEEKVRLAALKAEITHKIFAQVRTLSGGEMQRVAIARAVVMNPALILADEPTSHLDHKNAVLFLDLIEKFKSEGKSIVITSHDSLVKNSAVISKNFEMKNGQIA